MTVDLIIFDNDGTLSDSELLNCTVVSELLVSYGLLEYTPQYCVEHLAGNTMETIREKIEIKNKMKLPDNFIGQFIEWVQKRIPERLQPVPDAPEYVRALAAKYKVCVASNGERENVCASVSAIGLMDIFGDGHIFTKSQVANGKPAPDLFLFAAGKMGAAPERTIVIEDTPTGVRAGKAAGMTVIGITAVAHDRNEAKRKLEAAGADVVFESWEEIDNYITRACG